MQRCHHRFGWLNLPLTKYGKDYKEINIEKNLLQLGIGGHAGRLTKLFGGHKRDCDGQLPLTVRYFKRWYRHIGGEESPKSEVWQNWRGRLREILVAVPLILLLGENLHIFYKNKPKNHISNSTSAEHKQFFYSLPTTIVRVINSGYHINFISWYSLKQWMMSSKISYHFGKDCLHTFEKDDCETQFHKI